MLKELRREISDAPEELDERDEASSRARKLRELDEERRRFEEENFVRLTMSRADKKRRKALSRSAMGNSNWSALT